ncbi:MAG: HD domain-containing protein [Microbacterium sp.]|uniref:HD domain-containing protein n=1 Tax=Microbacterium sp. TaxID=51671 RepID=UPI0027260F16|nr:HD domain-containing protein [Microbacterium sp.]MDO8383537.1 HD domain-containing protein [Microbacterium sp.]
MPSTFDVERPLEPPTEFAARALEVARGWCSPALVNHCLRSWVWAKTLGESLGLTVDDELLFVAAMLHDLGVTEPFDAHAMPFESSGGAAAWTFAAGAGWEVPRRERVMQVIERHMWVSVDVDEDPEGFLLEAATSLDVAHADPEKWDAALRREVTARVPRLDFGSEFSNAIGAQASRKVKSRDVV